MTRPKGNEVHFCINFSTNNKKIPLYQADGSSISFFMSTYKDFISNIQTNEYKRFAKIKFDLSFINSILQNKQFSIFASFSNLGLPMSILNDVYTVDGYGNRLIGKTLIRGGRTENIFDIDNADVRLCYFHVLNLSLIFKLYILENKDSFQIIENLLSYLRNVILIGIAIFNIYLYLDDPSKIVYTDYVWSAISLIAIPFSKWLPKKILYYIINRNISFLFETHKSQTKAIEIEKK